MSAEGAETMPIYKLSKNTTWNMDAPNCCIGLVSPSFLSVWNLKRDYLLPSHDQYYLDYSYVEIKYTVYWQFLWTTHTCRFLTAVSVDCSKTSLQYTSWATEYLYQGWVWDCMWASPLSKFEKRHPLTCISPLPRLLWINLIPGCVLGNDYIFWSQRHSRIAPGRPNIVEWVNTSIRYINTFLRPDDG